MTYGCLIVNLGSPDEPTEEAIRDFLRNMLSDRCIVNFHPLLWKPILHGIILRVRPRKLIDRYRAIWTPEGSPLAVITRRQQKMLQDALDNVEVRYAFCASTPTIEQALASWNVDHLTVIPLYPQTATSTVTPIFERVLDFYDTADNYPHLVFASSYATEPAMIQWYQEQVAAALAVGPCDAVLLSFHGVPNQRYHLAAHYKAQCMATRDAIAAAFPDTRIEVSFQSKFGPGEWLGPATRERVRELPDEGVLHLVVATPAFVADCLETLEEVCMDYRDEFHNAGGDSYRVISPINDDPAFTTTLSSLYRQLTEANPR